MIRSLVGSLGLAALLTTTVTGDGGAPRASTAPAWSGKIAFQRNGPDSGPEMAVLFPDGSVVRVVDLPNGREAGPAWYPDGTKILFYHGRGGDHDVWVVDQDGSDPINLTNSPGIDDRGPAWLPDGSGIIWSSNAPGMPKIHVMAVPGGVPIRCDRFIGGRNTRPTVRPQMDMIAYNSNELRGGSNDKMMVGDISIDLVRGKCSITNRREVIPEGREWRPAWHPSGMRLAVAHVQESTCPRPGKEVYTVNVDGTGLTNLSCAPGSDYSPTYSRTGSQIVFTADRDGNRELYLMNEDGSEQTNLTVHPAQDSQADWWEPAGGR